MQDELTKYEKKRLIKEEKQEQRDTLVKKKKTKKWLILAIIAGLIIGAFYLLFTKESDSTPPIDFSTIKTFEGQTHVSQGTRVTYQSNPPTSGNHWATPLRDGIYDEEKPDEAIVHSMEHGRVWISYKPSISNEIKDELVNLLKNRSTIILTPRAANDNDIALAAWERLDTFDVEDTLDTQRILDFIKNYLNKGPEFIPGNAGGSEY